MSISTGSIGCAGSCSCSSGMADTVTSPRVQKGNTHPTRPADVHSTKPNAADAWRSEITGRINWFPDQFDQFLDQLVPSSKPYAPTHDISDAFSSFNPVKGQEVWSYDSLVSALSPSFLLTTDMGTDQGIGRAGLKVRQKEETRLLQHAQNSHALPFSRFRATELVDVARCLCLLPWEIDCNRRSQELSLATYRHGHRSKAVPF